jgi:hypothetical protein
MTSRNEEASVSRGMLRDQTKTFFGDFDQVEHLSQLVLPV